MRRPIRLTDWPASAAVARTTPRPSKAPRGDERASTGRTGASLCLSRSHRQTGSRLEELFYVSMVGANLHHGCQREYVYAPPRKFRADFAWPDQRLLVEIQGGIWTARSGHSGGSGITRDIDRGNVATLAGWRVLRFGPTHIRSGEALRLVAAALGETTR